MAEGFQDTQELWLNQADIEAQNNRDLRHQQGKGPYNIFILDTSSKIGDEGFKELKETFASMIEEYAKHPDIDENVAVVVCGKRVKFHRYFSNQYEDIKHCLETLEFGGPCPLAAAFLLASRSLRDGTSRSYVMNDYHIHPRLILLSNGRPTYSTITDFDKCPELENYEDDKEVLRVCRDLGKIHPIFCIPVGKEPNLIMLEFIGAQSRGGKIVYSKEVRQLAKYSLNIKVASKLLFKINNDGKDKEQILTSLVYTFPDNGFTDNDQDDIYEICLRKHLYCPLRLIFSEIEEDRDLYNERDPRMPILGSRVKRGRDWNWNDQDKFGPGTVIGHSKDVGWLKVEWDRDPNQISLYRYGSTLSESDKYDVKVCDEPRTLENESIATGCLVVRGPDWEWGEQDGGAGNIGSVLDVDNRGVILVRWKHGFMQRYRFGYEGFFDLEICDPFSTESVQHLKDLEQKAALHYPVGDQSVVDNALGTSSCDSCDKHLEKTNSHNDLSKPILNVTKGKYFRNDTRQTKPSSDIEMDGCSFSFAMKQWLWQDRKGEWVPFSNETNGKINKSYERDPKSTVVVMIGDEAYRIVMAKNIQINLKTREMFDVKMVTEQ